MRNMRKATTIVALIFFLVCTPAKKTEPELVRPQYSLEYETPAEVWDEAMPIGNGLLGALIWGDGNPLKISLDRTDLWDLRPVPEFNSPEYSYQTMREWVAEKRIEDLQRLYEKPYRNPGPTKIPAGRIELQLDGQQEFRHAKLELETAKTTIELNDGSTAEMFVHASRPTGVIRIQSKSEVKPKLVVPAFGGPVENKDPQNTRDMEVGLLGYPPPQESAGENWLAYQQRGWGDFSFAVVLMWKYQDDAWLGIWSIATSQDSTDPLKTATGICRDALESGFESALVGHTAWWTDFWEQSYLQVPNKIIERQWYLETFKFGSAARSDTPPITLQGPWTADNGLLPPWKGDYHHDLNTELSYWPAYSGNRLKEEEGFLNWLWETKPNAEAWTLRFFGLPGLNVPMTADLNQNQIGGWHQYTHSATTGAWLAQHFYLHWRYTLDREFLKEKAYPWFSAAATFLEAVTEKGPTGRRTLPLSSSPEINDNRLEAWFPAITNYDLALIRFVFEKAAELADEQSLTEDSRRWRDRLGEMPEFSLDPDTQKLLVAQGYPLLESHRHFSHLMAIHPLGLIHWESGPQAQKIILASLADLKELGTDYWTGYSFSWLASLAARARDGHTAEEALEIFATAFCLRSSFHCNGDQSGQGYSRYTYRPFTLEGNFAFAAGVQEMLLQSYSDAIRIFPAVPETWQDVAFSDLRTEGAFLISAVRFEGQTIGVDVFSEKGGECRLINPFGDSAYIIEGISKNSVKAEHDLLIATMTAGETAHLRLKRKSH